MELLQLLMSMNQSRFDELFERIKEGRNGENIGLSTGLPKLDKIIGGIQPARYYTVAAASSVGKTSLMLFIMYNLLKQESEEKPIYLIYFSLEIGEDVLLAKLIALYCAEEFGIYLTINDIFSFEHPIGDYEYSCLLKARVWVESISKYLIILDKGLNARILYSETMNILEKFGTKTETGYTPNNPNQKIIGIIDHGLLMRPETGRTQKEEIDLASSYIVTLKRKYNMSWFMLMQQNRESSSMDRRKADLSEPTLNDVKATGAVAEDSDAVIQMFFPFREKLVSYRGYRIIGEDALKQNHRSILITKNRYGVANQVINCGFWGSVGWFNELPDPNQIQNYSDYQHEWKNIPCKNPKNKIKDATPNNGVKKEITYSF